MESQALTDVFGMLGGPHGAAFGVMILSALTGTALAAALIPRPEPAPTKDLRHLAAVCMFPSVFSAFAISEGAPLWACAVAALAGIPLGLYQTRFIGRWKDEKVGPWVGGMMLLLPPVAIVVIALIYRSRG